jgi:hypothetical protein
MSANVWIWLSPEDRAELEGWVADRNTPQKLVWRSRIVLLSATGNGTMSIMRAVGKSKPSVFGGGRSATLCKGSPGCSAMPPVLDASLR